MSNYDIASPRKRAKTLIIVEGNHERNVLFQTLFSCFPELHIDKGNVWIYGTNIYNLYQLIIKEYDEEWENVDVDLPYIISKKKNNMEIQYKRDYTNIILVFDYERHDTFFSEEKILRMQQYFSDATDVGKLYLNYPMIESYQHSCESKEDFFKERVSVTLKPGDKYKALVRNMPMAKQMEYVERFPKLLIDNYGISKDKAYDCLNKIYQIASLDKMESQVSHILEGVVEQEKKDNVMYHVCDWMKKLNYVYEGKTFYSYMRELFCHIIICNIEKAYYIQNNEHMDDIDLKTLFYDNLDLMLVLQKQNDYSRDLKDGYIWVLNTSLFFIADYNINLIM